MKLRAGLLSLAALAALLPAAAPCDPGPDPEPRAAPTPIAREEYARRREALAARMPDDGVLVVFGAVEPEVDPQGVVQNPAFRYLAGIVEPGAVLVVARSGGRARSTLFVRPRDPATEVWNGARLGTERATALSGIPAREATQLLPVLDSLLAAGLKTVYTVSPYADDAPDSGALRADQQLVRALVAAHAGAQEASLTGELNRLRGTKSPAELDLLRRAIEITSFAHLDAMRTVEPGMNEFEVQALIEYTFRRHGADGRAFPSIVGSGPNATTLHYQDASRFMQPGETVVMDIGASYRGYAADVTRTVPVSGRFTPEQRQVYEIVLAAQKAAEAQVRPGVTLQAISQTASRVVAEGLARLGLIESPTATYDCLLPGGGRGTCPQSFLYYMHGLGHGIGLNVHDPEAAYFGAFAAGSAFTIEPGIYVRADVLDVLPDTPGNRALAAKLRPAVERYRNIGVRIEDDYFVTAGGVERISAGAPREIAEIERLMAEEGTGNRGRRPEVVEWYRQTEPR